MARTAEEAKAQAEATARAQTVGAEQNATVAGEETFTLFAKALSQSSPTIRAKIAQQLKDAGILLQESYIDIKGIVMKFIFDCASN